MNNPIYSHLQERLKRVDIERHSQRDDSRTEKQEMRLLLAICRYKFLMPYHQHRASAVLNV